MSNITKILLSTDEVELQTQVALEKRPRRELELSMLKDLSEFCAGTSKAMKIVINMLNVLDDLEIAIANKEATEISLTNDDVISIREAFERLEPKPNGWFRFCKSLLRQIAKVEKCA